MGCFEAVAFVLVVGFGVPVLDLAPIRSGDVSRLLLLLLLLLLLPPLSLLRLWLRLLW